LVLKIFPPVVALPRKVTLLELPELTEVALLLDELTDVALLLEELAEVIGALEVVPAEEPVAAYTRVKGAVAAAGMLSV
jgi:hypothetical protein